MTLLAAVTGITCAEERVRRMLRQMHMRFAATCAVIALLATACGQSSSTQVASGTPPATASPSAAVPALSTMKPGTAGDWPDLRPASAASCYVQYPDDLGDRANAFDATVTAVTIGEYDNNAGMRPATVELAVHEAFAGPERQTVVLRTWDGFLPSPDAQAAVGLRVLAAAGDTLDLMGCGFTRPYNAAEADDWRTAFR